MITVPVIVGVSGNSPKSSSPRISAQTMAV